MYLYIYKYTTIIINYAATEAACDMYSGGGGGGIACRSVSATRPTHRTMVHRFDIRRVYNYDNGGPRVPPPPSRIPSAAVSILLLFGFLFFSFPLGDGSTFIIIIIIINLLYYIDDDDDDDYDGGKRKYVTVVIVDGGACAPNNPTWARPDRGTYNIPARRHCTRVSIPPGHCRRRRRRYYIILLLLLLYI